MKTRSGYSFSRRKFLHAGLASGAAVFFHHHGFAGAPVKDGSPSRVRVAVMGVNGRGKQLVQAFAANPAAEVVFICDVDSRVIESAIEVAASAGQSVRPSAVSDFRRVLDDQSIDALAIATPDHWHAPAALLALKAGKHVYVEKPGSHNPAEAELLATAATKYKKVVQLGNQRRSWPRVQEAMQLIREGGIGKVDFARAWYTNGRPTIGKGKVVAVPEGFDYDLWQGPAPRRPFKDNLIPYNWHWHWHWGTGEMLNNGTHFVDLARLGLGVDFPVQAFSTGGRYQFQDDWETPDTQLASFRFSDGKTIQWEGRSTNRRGINAMSSGVSFFGTGGTLELLDNSYRIYGPDGELMREATSTTNVSTGVTGPGFDFDKDHVANFISAIRDGVRLNSDYKDCYKSVMLCHLANVSYRAGRSLEVDPANGHIKGAPEAMKYWSRQYEPGWQPQI